MRTIPLSNVKRAIDDGDIQKITSFAQSGLDIERDIIMGMPGWDALHYAVFKEDISITRYLLVRGANPNARDAEGFTTLHIAARTNNRELIMILIDHGADIHAETVYHWTPLHDACLVGNLDTALALIERGADIEATTDENKKPIDIAKENGHEELVAVLKDIERHSTKTNASPKNSVNTPSKQNSVNNARRNNASPSLNSNNARRNNASPDTQTANRRGNTTPSLNSSNNARRNNSPPLSNPSSNNSRRNTTTGRLFDKLDRSGKNYFLSDNTEFIGDNVLPTNGRPADVTGRYFFDTKDTKCEILRAFDSDVLEGMKRKGNEARNPYTRRQWPLEDVGAMKRVLKKVPSDDSPATTPNSFQLPKKPSPQQQVVATIAKTKTPQNAQNAQVVQRPQTKELQNVVTPPKADFKIAPTPTYVTHNKKTYKLRSGERGGRYILVKGQRVYMPGFEPRSSLVA
jgi:hypothetical protein